MTHIHRAAGNRRNNESVIAVELDNIIGGSPCTWH